MMAILGAITRLHAAAEALAAIGVAAAVERVAMSARVAEAVGDVLAAAGVPDPAQLAPPHRAMVAAFVRSAFGQTAHLLADPTRLEGWSYDDPDVLEGQGRASMSVPPLIAAAGQITDVGWLLDVGTGVGWLAVSATRVWPGCRVVGIDVWEPSVERAHHNIAEAGLTEQIEIRLQSVGDLPDRDRFDLTWLPSFFMLPTLMTAALDRILAATRPGGQIVVGRYEIPPDALTAAAMRLRLIRDGGSQMEPDEVLALLSASGWTDVRVLPSPAQSPLTLIAGRKP